MPPRNSSVVLPIVVLVGSLVIAAGAVGSTLAATRHWAAGRAEPAAVYIAVTPQSPETVVPQPETVTVPPDPTAGVPVSEDDAHTDLNAEVAQDQPTAESLVGSWVPQLSSKRPGLVADGVTYDYLAIWQDFQDLKAKYPSAVLLWSGDFSSYKSTDFWVTVVPSPYPSGSAANGWCDEEGIDTNDCYAKLLSHTAGPDGTTVLRQ